MRTFGRKQPRELPVVIFCLNDRFGVTRTLNYLNDLLFHIGFQKQISFQIVIFPSNGFTVRLPY